MCIYTATRKVKDGCVSAMDGGESLYPGKGFKTAERELEVGYVTGGGKGSKFCLRGSLPRETIQDKMMICDRGVNGFDADSRTNIQHSGSNVWHRWKNRRDSDIEEMTTKTECLHYMFETRHMRRRQEQSETKKEKLSKSWRFKFKSKPEDREVTVTGIGDSFLGFLVPTALQTDHEAVECVKGRQLLYLNILLVLMLLGMENAKKCGRMKQDKFRKSWRFKFRGKMRHYQMDR
ncbi:hypothetical protein Bca4012_020082 [Brassica carinata]|uniref:Uncharacterized protein n=1 Tax=Brassica carinata TaxID=52824 RepID=A0A8X7WGD5_BRACI|nr:hypothetical protein Bca52824_001494 [Brassica carinata]